MSKPKKINFELIEEEHPAYVILEKIRKRWHKHLDEAVISLAWRLELNPDKDGHLMLGKCVKASDLQRELVAVDFVILLNREVWEDFSEEQRTALIDHELCHASVAIDDRTGSEKYDIRGRKVWRIRKHDIEEFQAIVHRHGCYKKDLEVFAESLLKKRKTPLLNAPENQPVAPVN